MRGAPIIRPRWTIGTFPRMLAAINSHLRDETGENLSVISALGNRKIYG